MARFTTVHGISLALCCTLAGLLENRGLASPPAGYHLTWSDEFNGTSLDTNKWTYGLGQRNDAVNVPDAVTVGGGNLTIATYTSGAVNYTGFITTENAFQQHNGYFEARIKWSDDKKGMWSAFWMKWGTPEIDIAEHWQYGNGGTRYDENKIQDAVHWAGGDYAGQTGDLGLATGWHTYAVKWNETDPAWKIYWYVDGTCVDHRNDATLAPALELILSSEVNHFGGVGSVPAGGYGSQLASTTKMEVDYVRAYADVLSGDANLDGTVNFTDLNIVLTNYNKAGAWNQGDFNSDGLVNFTDLNVLLTNYNQSRASIIDSASYGLDADAIRALSVAGVTVVPEPSTRALAGIGLLALAGHRWRKRK